MLWLCLLVLHRATCSRVALVSYHGGNDPGQVNNLYLYDFLSNSNHSFIPISPPLISNEKALKLRSPRGMLYLPEQDALIHLNAYKGDSKIIKTPKVSLGGGAGVVMGNENLLHPYAIARHPAESVFYVSNQGTGDITRYELSTGAASANPVFAHILDPRAIAFDSQENLWVAEKNTTSLLRMDASANITLRISVVNPIGVVVAQDLVYVSSDNGPDGSAVFAFRTDTGDKVKTFRGPSGAIHHPCGLAVDVPSNSLFVMSQSARQIVRFDLTTQAYDAPVLRDLGDVPEHIIIIPYRVGEPTTSSPTRSPTTGSPSASPTVTAPSLSAPPSLAPSDALSPSSAPSEGASIAPSPRASPTVSSPSSSAGLDTGKESSSGLPTHQLIEVLAAVGAFVVALIIALLVVRCHHRRRKRKQALLAYDATALN